MFIILLLILILLHIIGIYYTAKICKNHKVILPPGLLVEIPTIYYTIVFILYFKGKIINGGYFIIYGIILVLLLFALLPLMDKINQRHLKRICPIVREAKVVMLKQHNKDKKSFTPVFEFNWNKKIYQIDFNYYTNICLPDIGSMRIIHVYDLNKTIGYFEYGKKEKLEYQKECLFLWLMAILGIVIIFIIA